MNYEMVELMTGLVSWGLLIMQFASDYNQIRWSFWGCDEMAITLEE